MDEIFVFIALNEQVYATIFKSSVNIVIGFFVIVFSK